MTSGSRIRARRYGWLAAMLLLLTACERIEQLKSKRAEDKRIECLDKICEGDVLPKYDAMRYAVFKTGGQFFLAPRDYGGASGSLAFLWPSKTPARKEGASKEATEFIPSSPGQNSNFYDVGIEIFLRANNFPEAGQSAFHNLMMAEKEGRLVSKATLRPGLEAWRIRRKTGELGSIFYVATNLKGLDGAPPVLSCDPGDHPYDRCTMGFFWQPDLFAGLRFNSKHGPDWPEIYAEVIRVLQLLKKA